MRNDNLPSLQTLKQLDVQILNKFYFYAANIKKLLEKL